MKKRMLSGILAGILLLFLAAPTASAEETSGTWGEGITWEYADHTLTITGSGDMEAGQPWAAFKDKIETVIFKGGITKVGDGAFENYDALETIDFGDSMREIGKRAFYDCNDIVEIRLPDTFRIFGPESFRNCGMLSRVICEGGIMPSFKSACMHTGNAISVFYPPNNPWAWEYTNPVMAAYGGLVAFYMASEDIMENGFTETEPAETEAEEEEKTEAVETVTETEAVAVAAAETVPETSAATEVPTEAPTEAPTETTVPETVPETTAAVTEAETEATEMTLFEEEPEPTEEPLVKKPRSSSWMGLVMIVGVITFLLAGAMIFRSSRRDRY